MRTLLAGTAAALAWTTANALEPEQYPSRINCNGSDCDSVGVSHFNHRTRRAHENGIEPFRITEQVNFAAARLGQAARRSQHQGQVFAHADARAVNGRQQLPQIAKFPNAIRIHPIHFITLLRQRSPIAASADGAIRSPVGGTNGAIGDYFMRTVLQGYYGTAALARNQGTARAELAPRQSAALPPARPAIKGAQ
ncbi:MAG: hypothetical protein GEV05_22295 [Betaproteobacteria bacterium]|nr:hypothetical protein [Betaproteobacteria bacterium]